MRIGLFNLLVTVAFLVSFHLFAEELTPAEMRNKAFIYKNQGNYKDAFELFQQLTLGKENQARQVPAEFTAAIYCLRRLNRVNEIDTYREQVIKKNSTNWRLLESAAQSFFGYPQYGYMIAGKFERGNHRGGGKRVNAFQRDRIRALQLYVQAMPLVKAQAANPEQFTFYRNFARAILSNRGYSESWRLQYLSNLKELPDYEPGYGYYRAQVSGAPVDAEGNPVFYYVPKKFSEAENDGERWRWLLKQAKLAMPKYAAQIEYDFALFLNNQFGVQTMSYFSRYSGFDIAKVESGPYAVNTLNEDETIARLASGVKRFQLPGEFNFIKIFRRVAKDGNRHYAMMSVGKLATIFSNRRQYPKSADYWRERIRRFGKQHGENSLNQIVGNLGKFEPVTMFPTGKKPTVNFRFRNADQADLKLEKVKIKILVEDIKAYLRSNPAKFDWQKTDINRIGYRMVTKNQKKYLSGKVKEWSLKLDPAKNHYDRRITVEVPETEPGMYLLTAKLKNGNISRIIVWLADAVIASKQLDKQQRMYFVADAVTGKPVPNANLDFFGYKIDYISRNLWNKLKGRRYNIHVEGFNRVAGLKGVVKVSSKDVKRDYNWLITATDDAGRYAVLGFNRFWYSNYYNHDYNQTKIYCITDCPVYRPKQKVEFKFWMRKAQYDMGENVSVFAGKSFQLELRNPRNEVVLRKTFKADRFGGFSGSYELPENAILGMYRFRFNNIYGRMQANFRVEEYKKPEYEVTVEAPSEPVKLGDKITATIKAKYYFGAPVAEAKVKYTVKRTPYQVAWYPPMIWDWLYGSGYWWFAYDYPWFPKWRYWGCFRPRPWWMPYSSTPPELVMQNEVPISPDGTVKVEIDSAVAKAFFGEKDQKYEITAEVVDKSRRTIVGKGSVIAAVRPFKVYAWVDRGYFREGDTVKASFQARTVDGKPVKGNGILKLYRVTYDSAGKPGERVVQQWRLDTDAEGKAKIQVTAAKSGQFRLEYTVTDSKKNSIAGGYVFNVYGSGTKMDDYRFNAVEIVNDKQTYVPGEKVRLTINTAQANSTVLLFLRPSNGVYLDPIVLNLKGKTAFYDLPVSKKDMPNFFIEAMTVSGGKLYTATKEIIVPPEKRVLNISVLPSKKKYQPGESAKVRLRITDIFGRPVTASTVVTIYDKSVEYISGGSNVPEIKSFFWKWRRRHNTNTISSLSRWFSNLLKNGERTLYNIGAFGCIVASAGKDHSKFSNVLFLDGHVNGTASKSWRGEKMLRAAPAPLMKCKEADMDFCDEKGLSAKKEAKPSSGPAVVAESMDQVHVRKEFADTAYWNACLTPNSDGEVEVELKMPENLTTWKIKAWSLAGGTRVGQGETEVITSKNFIVRLQAPRFFVETDEVTLSAIVHNYLPESKTAKVVLELGGDCLKTLDKPLRTVTIKPNGEVRVDWLVKAAKEGEAVITMKAAAPGASDAMQMKFPVYVHGMLKMESFCGSIRPEDKKPATLTVTVPEKRREQETKLVVRYSPTLAGAMIEAIPYLLDYPYGCTEQTLNRFVPAVITQKVVKELGVNLDDLRKVRTNLNAQELGDASKRAKQWKRYQRNPVFSEKEMNAMVAEGLARLQFMQNGDGGWGWFCGAYERSYPHTTAVVVHGLQIARANGAKVNASMLNRGINWLKAYQERELGKLNNYPSKTHPYKRYADNLDALVYMVLSDAKSFSKSMQDYLYRDRNHLSIYGKSLFALGLFKGKETGRLKMLMKNISQYLVVDDENQTAYLNLGSGNWWWCWYGHEIETMAMYLKLLAHTDPKGKIAPMLVKYLLNNRKHGTYWNSTRDTAYCIEAFADFIHKSGESKPDMTVEVLVDGKLRKTVKITPENLFSFDGTVTVSGAGIKGGKHKIEIRRKGRGALYFNAYLTYFTLEDYIKAAGLEVKVARKYYKLQPVKKSIKVAGSRGQAGEMRVEKFKRIPLHNLSTIKSGDLVEIELVIDSKNDYEYLIFEDFKPAGFEPCDLRSGYTGNAMGAYVEFRDEKTCFFVRQLARGRHSVSYRMRAEIPGRFSALPARGYAMYAPELKGNSNEIKLKVED